ncbi:MAG: AAA family ATPase, partial [Chloroflexota bacterium]
MFLDREGDLARLDRWWQNEQPELITVYGRRQVGKTELIVRFLGGKPAIYFYADRQLVTDHLRAFTEQVLLLADDPVLRVQPFSSWEAAFTYVLRLAERWRIAIVID